MMRNGKIKDTVKGNFKKYFWYFIVFLMGVLLCGLATHCDTKANAMQPFPYKVVESAKYELNWFEVAIQGAGHVEIYAKTASSQEIFGLIQDCPVHLEWHTVLFVDGVMLKGPNFDTKEEAKAFVEEAYKKYLKNSGLF